MRSNPICWQRFKAEAMQAAVAVPAKGGSVMVALETLPLGSNVTTTVTLPVGPPLCLQACASVAASANGALVAAASKRYVTPDKLSLLMVGDLSKIEAGIRELKLGEIVVLDTEGKPVVK